jgi:hypothetical protein
MLLLLGGDGEVHITKKKEGDDSVSLPFTLVFLLPNLIGLPRDNA